LTIFEVIVFETTGSAEIIANLKPNARVSDCGLITILTQLNRQNRQSFRSFITNLKWFSNTRMSLLFQLFQATLLFYGAFPKGKIFKSVLNN